MQNNEAVYKFDPDEAITIIEEHWTTWSNEMNMKRSSACPFVIGISGGKDSTVTAALGVRTFGKHGVVGVLMPNGKQADIEDSRRVCNQLGIKSIEINIEKAYDDLLWQFFKGYHLASRQAEINLAPRIRMATLYMVAQSIGGVVVNTCNLSEDMVGYATLFGDNAGSYAPIHNLTVTEVKAIGDTLYLPRDLVHKTPADGLQEESDEDRLGMKYEDIDRYIRLGPNSVNSDIVTMVDVAYNDNKFKLDMVNIEGPTFPYPNFVIERNKDK